MILVDIEKELRIRSGDIVWTVHGERILFLSLIPPLSEQDPFLLLGERENGELIKLFPSACNLKIIDWC